MNSLLENYGGEMTLEEDTYEAARTQALKLDISPAYGFREEHDSSETECTMFDAMKGEYIEQ